MRGISMGSLNYPGSYRIEEYQKSFFYQSCDYIELPWLNLLYYLPLCEAQRDQPTTIGYYFVLRNIYDKQEELFYYLKEQLKELFPDSFLFQETAAPFQYCEDDSDILTLERLTILSHQMIVFDFLDRIGEEMTLAESIRAVWRRTRMPKQRMTLHAFDYENALWPKDYDKLTWFVPFTEKYPKLDRCVQRYLSIC